MIIFCDEIKGEVALPGGKKDEEDVDDTATALREAMEEIGLHSSLLQVVDILEPFISAVLSWSLSLSLRKILDMTYKDR